MRDNPGITQRDESTPPSRDIPRATREQQDAREPSANIIDWLRYLSGSSFLLDSVPGALGNRSAQERTNELVNRIGTSLTRGNAQPGVNELLMQPMATPESDGAAGWWRDEGRNWSTAINYALTNDEDRRAEAIRNIYPNAEFRRDDRGYLQVRREPTEAFAYLNKPGVSVTDLTDVAGALIRFLPAARLSAVPRTLGGRALTAGGTSAATEYASQSLAQPFGGPEPDLGDAAMAGVFGAGGQAGADVLLGVTPALYQSLRRATGFPETPSAPLPDPVTPNAPAPRAAPRPTATPDRATRGTPDEIASLEDELAALRQRGPTGTVDPNDRHVVARSVLANERSPDTPLPIAAQREIAALDAESRIPEARRSSEANALRQRARDLRAANELDDIERQMTPAPGSPTLTPDQAAALTARASSIRQQFPNVDRVRVEPLSGAPRFGPTEPTLSAEGGVQAQLARTRHAEEIDALERRIAEARQPYFADGPPDVPVTSMASDDALNAGFQLLRGQRIPADAGDALAARIEERLHSRVLPNGDIGPGTGMDIAAIRQAGDDFANTQNALVMIDRLGAQARIGTATYRQAQMTRNALRHFENTATSDVDRRAMERILLAYDEWLDLAFSTQRQGVQGLDDILNASGLTLNQRTASMARRDRPVEPQRPITTTAPPAPRPTATPTRSQVRNEFDRQNIPASRGQVSQDIRARQREDDLIQSGEPRAGRFADDQNAAILRRGREIATRGQTPVSDSVEEAGEVLRQDIQQAFDTLDDLADATYTRAFELLKGQRVLSDSADSLGTSVTTRLERGAGARDDPMYQYEDTGLRLNIILGDPQNFPQSSSALRQIESLRDLIESGTINFAVVAKRRQAINHIARSARGEDARAMGFIRNGFDEWLNAQLGRAQTFRITSVEEAERAAAEASLRNEAHSLYQEANAIWSERQRLFSRRSGGSDPGGAAIERIRDPRGEITGTQIINAIFNTKGVPTTAAVGALRRIRDSSLRALPGGRQAPRGVETPASTAFSDPNGTLTPAMMALREAFWHRIMAPAAARSARSVVPGKAVATNLDRAINGEGAGITRLLHTDAEIEQMRQLLQVMKYVERPVGVNTSGTAITAARMLQSTADGLAMSLPRAVAWVPRLVRVMFGRDLDDLARGAEAHQRFSRPIADVDYGSSQSGAAAGQVIFDQENRSDARNMAPRRETEDAETAPGEAQGYDPMEGITDIQSHAAGTVTFYDGQRWITLPTRERTGGVSGVIREWRDGRLEALSDSASQDEARAAAQSYRANPSAPQPFMAPGARLPAQLQPSEQRSDQPRRSFDQPEARRSDNFEDRGVGSPLLERRLQDPYFVRRFIEGQDIVTRIVTTPNGGYRVEWGYAEVPDNQENWFNAGVGLTPASADALEAHIARLMTEHGAASHARVKGVGALPQSQQVLQQAIDQANATATQR